MGNHHRNSQFSNEKWWIFPVRYVKLPEGMNGVFSFFPAQGPSHYFGHIWTISSSAGCWLKPAARHCWCRTQHETTQDTCRSFNKKWLAISCHYPYHETWCFNMLQYASICCNMLHVLLAKDQCHDVAKVTTFWSCPPIPSPPRISEVLADVLTSCVRNVSQTKETWRMKRLWIKTSQKLYIKLYKYNF